MGEGLDPGDAVTTTIHMAADRASIKARMMALLDDATEKFARPRSVTFTLATVRDARRMRCFVVDATGEIVCIDAFLATTYPGNRAFREGQGFALGPREDPAGFVFAAIQALLGVEVARSITIREVR